MTIMLLLQAQTEIKINSNHLKSSLAPRIMGSSANIKIINKALNGLQSNKLILLHRQFIDSPWYFVSLLSTRTYFIKTIKKYGDFHKMTLK